MLGAYNVNRVPCELLIDQEALVWWPRAATTTTRATLTTTSDKSANKSLSSPIKHIARLSNQGASKRCTQSDREFTNQSSGERFDETEIGEHAQKRRRIDFDQIIGVTTVHVKGRRLSKKRPASDRNQYATISDETTTTTTNTTTEQNDSEIRETRESTRGLQQLNKLKIYYVKRNEKKMTGRLLKLKKITLEVLQTTESSNGNESSAAAQQDEPSPSSSTSTPTSSASSLSDNIDQEAQVSVTNQLNGVHELIEQHLELKRRQRPKRLLVFVNPYGGKGKALHLYKSKVCKILELAQIECQLVVTKYANHARDTIEDPMFNLEYFDGIICIGGDGMFGELMNGLLFRFNRDKLLTNELNLINKRLSDKLSVKMEPSELEANKMTNFKTDQTNQKTDTHYETPKNLTATTIKTLEKQQLEQQLSQWRSSLGGIGEQFESPNIPIGVIGAGSTDANLFGFIGTNDAVSATLNIVLGNQIQIDVSSIHSIEDDRLLRFVSTFVAYGYFGDVIRESEKLRWLGPSRYDVTALNSLIKYRNYNGLVRILRSTRDGTPLDLNRCHLNCELCRQTTNNIYSNRNNTDNIDNNNHLPNPHHFEQHSTTKKEELANVLTGRVTRKIGDGEFEIIEEEGSFVGVNAAVTACRCPQTRKGFSPGNHLANGCADLILVRSCSRIQYINYLIRTGYTNKSAFDLGYVDAYRCRQFEFIVQQQQAFSDSKTSENVVATDDNATSDYQSKGSTKLSTNDTSIASSRHSSNANSLDSKHFASHQMAGQQQQVSSSNGHRQPASPTRTKYTLNDDESSDLAPDELSSSSWNADGEILREQSIRVKVNNKLLRVFGTGEPQPRPRCRKQRTVG